MQQILEMIMNQHFEQWSNVAKKLQEPLQAITELNIKTLQGLNYLKAEEVAKIKKPEELLEKQVNVVVANGHKAVDYMQKSFQILEKTMLSFVEEAKKVAGDKK